MAAVWGYVEPLRILCTREMQNSIKESMHAEIKNAIESTPWLAAHYDVGVDYIKGKNGTQFLFRGLRHNISSIKSLAQIDLCIVEEAADVPQHSWRALLPTIRAHRSEIWCVYNPKAPTDPVDAMFRQDVPPRSMVVELNYSDNPWFPPELEEQRLHAQEVMNPSEYAWIWGGAYLEQSDAQVFAGKWRLGEFEPGEDWDGPYYGLDYGFSQDETAAVKAWVHDARLYVENEVYEKRLELDDTAPTLMAAMPGIEKHTVRADSARPESISYMQRHGMPRVEACKKGKGSVEDGIEFIRSFKEVIIHPRCKNTANEFSLYSYKTDRLTGDILPILVDANNHAIDSLRYALEPIMRQDTYSWIGFS